MVEAHVTVYDISKTQHTLDKRNLPANSLSGKGARVILPMTTDGKGVSLMLGMITLLIALSAQIGFLVYQMVTKNRQTKVKNIVRIAAFAVFSLLLITGVYWWGFRWMGLFILLVVLAALSAIHFIRRPKAEKEYKGLTAIRYRLRRAGNGCVQRSGICMALRFRRTQLSVREAIDQGGAQKVGICGHMGNRPCTLR